MGMAERLGQGIPGSVRGVCESIWRKAHSTSRRSGPACAAHTCGVCASRTDVSLCEAGGRERELGRGERLGLAAFGGGVAGPLTLLFLPLCLFVSDFFFLFLPSPQPPRCNALQLHSGNKGPEHLSLILIQPPSRLSSPAPGSQGGRSDCGGQSCPFHIIFTFIFLSSLLKRILRSFPVSHTPPVAANVL